MFRAWESSRPRSSAAIQPAAQTPSSWLFEVTCGTSYLSRTMVTPGRGTFSVVPGPAVEMPYFSDLKYWVRSELVTLSNSGVRPSYMSAWVSAPDGGGTVPYWPEGMMLRAVCE